MAVLLEQDSWEDLAVAELAAKEDLDVERAKTSAISGFDGVEVSFGRNEYLVFKNQDEAERYAIQRVTSDLDDDPTIFNQDWLQNHLTVTPTDIRVISADMADSQVSDLSDEDALDQAGLRDEWRELEDKKDQLEDQAEIKKIEEQQDDLVDSARDTVTGKIIDDITDRLKKDPLDYAKELGFDVSDLPPWISVDTKGAAKDAVNTDGVPHFLASYDGNELELKSKAVAYRTN